MPYTNIPGQVDYYNRRQQVKPPGSGPFVPTGPTGPTTPTPAPVPQPGGAPPSPMAGYIDRRAQVNLAPQAPIPTGWQAYRRTPVSTPATAAPVTPTPSQAPTLAQAPGPVQGVQVTPAPVQPTAPATPKAGEAGSTLQDPGQITAAGKAYADRVTRNLSGDNPLVKNAQMTEDTAASRRAYSARKGASEAMAQTAFAPGSAQYQRVMTEAQAGVDSANQAGQANVNALARAAGQDTLAQAQGLEDQQYARAVGERTNRQQQDAALGQTIEDPKARYAFQRMVASGVSPQDAYRAIVGETGTISETYRGLSPVGAVRQDATDWVKATQPGLAEGSPEFQAAVTARMQEADQAQRQPVTSSNKETAKEDLLGKIRNGEPLTSTETTDAIKSGVIPTLAAGAVPRGSGNVAAWLKDNPGGKFNVSGQVYTLVKGGSSITGRTKYLNQPRHTDYAVVTDSQGNTKYFWDGKIQDKPPKHLGPVEITPFGF